MLLIETGMGLCRYGTWWGLQWQLQGASSP